MLKKIIALILMIIISLAGIVQPSYAELKSSTTIFDNHQESYITEYHGDHSHDNDVVDSLKEGMGNVMHGAINMLEFTTGAAMTCYALHLVSTSFFPPAAFAGAFCPAIFGMTVTAQAVVQMVD